MDMTSENNIIFDEETEDDYIEEEFDNSQIYTSTADTEIKSFVDKICRGTIDVQPNFQRQFVWKVKTASRLIESVLLGIPLPTIYLSEENGGKKCVIDGQQRLTTFHSFITTGKMPDGTDFKLADMKVLKELNGKSYKDLDEVTKDKIGDFSIRTITFLKNSGNNLKFEIFERLNTGSVPLNDQELRNCIYRGAYNDLLKEMSEFEDFKYLLGRTAPDNRMNDVEMVLRFCAFYHASYLKYKPSMKSFLNSDMEKYRDISKKDADDLKNHFKNGLRIVRTIFDKNAFKRFYKGNKSSINGSWESKKINKSLFDITLGVLCNYDLNIAYPKIDSIKEELIDLMVNDDEFIESIEKSTSSVKAVRIRFDKFRLLVESILGVDVHEPRIFSHSLKEALFNANPVCSICNQKIQSIDDSAVDHIEQYWKGGKTIPENARLTHRFCNWSRARKE